MEIADATPARPVGNDPVEPGDPLPGARVAPSSADHAGNDPVWRSDVEAGGDGPAGTHFMVIPAS